MLQYFPLILSPTTTTLGVYCNLRQGCFDTCYQETNSPKVYSHCLLSTTLDFRPVSHISSIPQYQVLTFSFIPYISQVPTMYQILYTKAMGKYCGKQEHVCVSLYKVFVRKNKAGERGWDMELDLENVEVT